MMCKSKGWMDERCFRPLLCTVKAELGRGQPGLMMWEIAPKYRSLDPPLWLIPSELAAAHHGKLKGGIDKGGYYDVEMKGRMQKGA